MPRIDPLKLLVCLSVLLAPNGGIRSANEVKRLANLMAKFSKKLVSKCIYIQILKCTETELLSQFMAAGGWSLVHMWLADGITSKNWPLIQELLELLLCCPVDVERLKSNTAPKLVKTLSKDSSHEGVRLLATKLVEQWLKIARNDIRAGQQTGQANQTPPSTQVSPTNSGQFESQDMAKGSQVVLDESLVDEQIGGAATGSQVDSINNEHADGEDNGQENVEEAKKAFNTAVAESNSKKAPLLFKITVKNGKQVLAKVESPSRKNSTLSNEQEADESKSDILTEEDSKEALSEDATTTDKSQDVDETDSTEKLEKSDDGEDDKKDSEESDKSKDKEKKVDEKERSKDKALKDKHRDKDKDKKSSSSSGKDKSSKSSSSSSKHHHHHHSSSSSSSKKSSSSSSSSKSSSSSSRDRDRDRHGSKSSSHHKSSSSSSSKSSGSSKSSSDKHREHKSSGSSKDKEHAKASSPTSSKLDKISKKDDKLDTSTSKSSPITAKKASISIEVRNSEHRPKTVKTYNSQFRSHGLSEEAPPPPSRKGLKKPSSTPTTPPVIGSTATGTLLSKRSSPPPSSKDCPPEKKSREDPAERPGAIKLIPPKRQPSLVESDMFMDALSATLRIKKRKRRHSGSEGAKAGDKHAANATSATVPAAAAGSGETQDKQTNPASPTGADKKRPSPPASPTAEKTAAAVATGAARPSSPTKQDGASTLAAAVSGGEPASPKTVAAPMSFYRDTLADTEETSEEKKDDEAENKKEKTEGEESVDEKENKEVKTEAIPDTPAEPDADDDADDVIKKPKRLKSELIEDDDAEEKNELLDAVGEDVAKKMAQSESPTEPTEAETKKQPGPGCGPDGPPGVLVIHRRKGPKKQLKWKAQEELEEIRYFELDITERCNVTRTFTDLRIMERVDERQKYMLARKTTFEDMMMERTNWQPLVVVDNVPPHLDGANSQERRIQRDRERNVLQALYFNRHMIPDSPAEPDVEVYSISEPAHIPLEDVTGNPDSVNDFTSMPWPEPKSTPPHESAGFNSPFFPGQNNDFPPFGGVGGWELPGQHGPGSLPGMFPPGRMPQGMPHGAGNNGPPPHIGNAGAGRGHNVMPPMGLPPHMQPNMPPNMPPNMGPNMHPHPNMFPNNFVRGPPPMQQHMNDHDEDNFRNGPPPLPPWHNSNNGGGGGNRGHPPSHQGNFNNRGGFGGRGGGNWHNNRDNDRGGRGGNYRPPWLQNNRGNHAGHRGRKW